MLISREWLKTYFKKDIPDGKILADTLMRHSFEIEGTKRKGKDFIIDVDVLPNRAHDCLSHKGIAYEIAGLFDLETKKDEERYTRENEVKEIEDTIGVEIQNKGNCARYLARIIKNIKVKKSPKWLKERVESIGQKSINNLVDATNYVLFDLGQPIHVFDLDKLDGSIIIRDAKEGEQITLLSGEEIKLDKSMLIIADEKKPLAIAGVKGGDLAEVDENTKNVVIEVANFDYLSIRKTRQKLGLMTDASKRFENELSPELAFEAMEYITNLILNLAGTADTGVGRITDEYVNKVQDDKSIEVKLDQINTLLGVNLKTDEVIEILNRFKYEFETEGETFQVKIPYLRLDLNIPEDLIEEIGRIYGYDKIKSKTVENIIYDSEVNKLFFYQNKIRNFLIKRGFSEIETYTFRNKGEVEIENPIASDKSFLRKNLREGMKEALDFNSKNADLFGFNVIKLFEIGKAFTNKGENNLLSVGIQNVNKQAKIKNGSEDLQFNETLEKLSEELEISLKTEVENGVLEINLDELIPKLKDRTDYGDILDLFTYGDKDKFKPFSQYPFILRDISLWAPKETNSEDILKIIEKNSGELLLRVDLFDRFSKDDKISYAFRLIFQSEEKTLSDIEINKIMKGLEKKLVSEGWEIR